RASAEGSGSLNPFADRCRPGLHTQTAAIAHRSKSRFHTASVKLSRSDVALNVGFFALKRTKLLGPESADFVRNVPSPTSLI
ncbi:hypothetical protein ACETIH_07715, partial [Microvirga arabica]